VTVPVTAAVAVGVKDALIVQEAPAATEAQLSVSVKFALAAMVNPIAVVPLFDTVKILAALGDPTATLPNARFAGVMVAGAMPVPVTLTDKGLPKPL
jgi:hypothetical protein